MGDTSSTLVLNRVDLDTLNVSSNNSRYRKTYKAPILLVKHEFQRQRKDC